MTNGKLAWFLGLGEGLVAALAIYPEFCYNVNTEQGLVLHLAQLVWLNR